jgi:hypothetical protein
MRTSFKVFPGVSWGELAVTEDLVGFSLSLMWELGVGGARVD